jgi:hypothetical protein
MKNTIFDVFTTYQNIGIFVASLAKVILQAYVLLINLKKKMTHIIAAIIIYHLCTKKFEIFTTFCVNQGKSLQAFAKDSVILGTINIIIPVTISIVNPNNIIGYIIAHLTFHFSSILSSKFVSNSNNILPICHVFSHTAISEIVRLSNTLGYCDIV